MMATEITEPWRDWEYRPSGPLDPLAERLAAATRDDPVWQGVMRRPAQATREAFAALAAAAGPRPADSAEDVLVAVENGDVRARIYRASARPLAIIVWAHGGGFTFGSLESIDSYMRALTLASGCAVVSVDYRLAPEHRFPTALLDMIAVTRWAIERRAAIAGAAAPIFLGGDSAGGNLATVAARKLRQAGDGAIRGQVLAYPCVDSDDSEAMRRFEPPYLTLAELSWFYDQYLPDRSRRRDPDFAPIYATDLARLPPTLILTAEHDILTEPAERYGRKLTEAGVEVEVRRYAGMIHGFLTKDIFAQSSVAQANAAIAAFVRQAIGVDQDFG
jgi:acetyl esterase